MFKIIANTIRNLWISLDSSTVLVTYKRLSHTTKVGWRLIWFYLTPAFSHCDVPLSSHDLTDGRSSEKGGALDESNQSNQSPSKGLQLCPLASSPTNAVELTESVTRLQSPEKTSKKKELQAEDTTQQLGRTCLMTLEAQGFFAHPSSPLRERTCKNMIN